MTTTQVYSDLAIWGDEFIGNRTLTSTPEGYTGWTSTSSGVGSPSIKGLDNPPFGVGALQHLLDTTSGAESIAQTHGGIRSFPLANTRTVNILGSMSNQDGNTASFYGVGGLYTASSTQPTAGSTSVWSSMTELCGFAVGASGEVFCEARGGGVDSGCVDTNYAFPNGTTQVLLTIDVSKSSDVKFYMTTPNTGFRRVDANAGVTFNISNFTGSLQPVLVTGRANGALANTALTFNLDKFWVDYEH